MISGTATALEVSSEAGRYTTVSAVNATMTADGLQIEGNLQRCHFGPRRPLRGTVVVAVRNGEGEIIRQKTLQTSSLFVPKGIRQASFSGLLEGSIPQGASVTITPAN